MSDSKQISTYCSKRSSEKRTEKSKNSSYTETGRWTGEEDERNKTKIDWLNSTLLNATIEPIDRPVDEVIQFSVKGNHDVQEHKIQLL